MKDAASRIAEKYIPGGIVLLPEVHRGNCANRIRLAIRRAVKSERERCVKCVQEWCDTSRIENRGVREPARNEIIDAIQAKRPSRRK